jgi:GxxExxY protein
MEKTLSNIDQKTNSITGAIVNSAMCVHSLLGPGLLEEVYKQSLAVELTSRGYEVQLEQQIPVWYKATKIELGYRLDLLVDKEIIVEIKSVQQLAPIHKAQLLSYLKLSRKKSRPFNQL